jgi:hypothetical protein
MFTRPIIFRILPITLVSLLFYQSFVTAETLRDQVVAAGLVTTPPATTSGFCQPQGCGSA